MNRLISQAVLTAGFVTVVALVTWQATGGDYYTKYEVIEEVQRPVDPNDPLAAAGFYDSDTRTETVRRDAFRLGLLPTPSGILDKHAVSVVSVSLLAWGLVLGVVLWTRLRGMGLGGAPT